MTAHGDCVLAFCTDVRWRKASFKRSLSTFLAALAIAAAAVSGVAAAEPAFSAKLKRGINLAHWFAQSNTHRLNPQHLANFIGSTDFQRLASSGFNHVRLAIELTPAFGVDDASRKVQELLLGKIRELNAAGLAVVVNLHPNDIEKKRIEDDHKVLIEGWTRFAGLFVGFAPDMLALEIMNEPYPIKKQIWRELQPSVVKAMRGVAPHHTIIVNPGDWSSIDAFEGFEPLPDANLVYTAHVYDPALFTHQGATWGWEVAKDVKNLPWPIPAAQAHAQASLSAVPGRSFDILKDQIATGMMDRKYLTALLDKLADWEKRNGVRIWIGEFGVYRKVAPREPRLVWHRELRAGFEARGWGWALWDYTSDMGILLPGKQRPFDGELLEALGLKP